MSGRSVCWCTGPFWPSLSFSPFFSLLLEAFCATRRPPLASIVRPMRDITLPSVHYACRLRLRPLSSSSSPSIRPNYLPWPLSLSAFVVGTLPSRSRSTPLRTQPPRNKSALRQRGGEARGLSRSHSVVRERPSVPFFSSPSPSPFPINRAFATTRQPSKPPRSFPFFPLPRR